MNTTNVTPIWDWDSVNAGEITSHAAVILYSSMTLALNAGNSGMAGLVHRHGVVIQSKVPSGELSARKVALKNEFDKAWESEINWIMSEEAGEKQLTKHDLRAMVSAVDKVSATIGFGGDLKVLDTASKCEKFNKDRRAAKKSANDAAELREEAKAMAEVSGLTEGTEAFEQFVTAYIKENTPDNVDGGKPKESVSGMQMFASRMATLLEKLEEADYPQKQLDDLLSMIERTINAKLKQLVDDAAAESGLLEDVAS